MSSLASSSLLAERGRISPFKGCSWGSTATSLDTFRKTPASVSRRSLCLSVWKPPILQIRTWSTSNALPHRQDWGARRRGHPYRSATASRKALLWRTEPCLSRGITESHEEAPRSWLALTHCRCRYGSVRMMLSAAAISSTRFPLLRRALVEAWRLWQVSGSPFWSKMSFTRGAHTSCEALWCFDLTSVGLIIPMPPRRDGRARRLRTSIPGECWSVSAGTRCFVTASTRGWNSSSEVIVETRRLYVHRLISPKVKAA